MKKIVRFVIIMIAVFIAVPISSFANVVEKNIGYSEDRLGNWVTNGICVPLYD